MSRLSNILGLAGWVAFCFAVAGIAGRWIPGEWYAALNKPAWTPPGWLFAPVWTTLYAMMGIAAWLVWRKGGFKEAWLALGLFLFQLTLNGLWIWIFFGLHRPGMAAVEIALLWLAIAATIIAFWSKNRTAGALLIPYGVWVGFAAILNLQIWRLNR